MLFTHSQPFSDFINGKTRPVAATALLLTTTLHYRWWRIFIQLKHYFRCIKSIFS